MIENDLAVLSKIPFPASREDFDILIRCRDDVVPLKPHLSNHWCRSGDLDVTDLSKVFGIWRGENLVVSAARRDGQEVPLHLKYSVYIQQTGNKKSIRLFQHHGDPKDTLGTGFLGPQWVIADTDRVTCHTCTYGVTLPVSLVITEAGNIQDLEIQADSVNDSCRQSLMNFLRQQSYIPATQNGIPVKGRTLAYFERHTSDYLPGEGTGGMRPNAFAHCHAF